MLPPPPISIIFASLSKPKDCISPVKSAALPASSLPGRSLLFYILFPNEFFCLNFPCLIRFIKKISSHEQRQLLIKSQKYSLLEFYALNSNCIKKANNNNPICYSGFSRCGNSAGATAGGIIITVAYRCNPESFIFLACPFSTFPSISKSRNV